MKRNRKKCHKCGKEISFSNYQRHISSCGNYVKIIKEEWKQKNGSYKCPHCEKEYSFKGIGTHIWSKHGEGKNSNSNSRYKNGYIVWNKGLTKENDERVRRLGKKISEEMKGEKNFWYGKHFSEEHKQKISRALSKNNHGGKCKWYEINGVFVQGTWERDLAKHMSVLKIKWKKIKINSFTFEYIKNGEKKHYTPDFLIEDDILLELKGFWWGDDKEKMRLVLEQNDINIKIIEKEQYKKLLETRSKYEFFQKL